MIDYLNKPGKELLLDLVNDDNKSTFNFDQISFGPPVVVSMNQDERNTSCIVTAIPGAPWYGSQPIFFERLFFERMFVDQTVEVSTDEVQNDQQLLDALNAEYGLELQPTDVEIIGQYPSVGNYGSLTIKAKPGSYVYLGEFIIDMVGSKIQLINYITHKVLDGLSYPAGDVSDLTPPRTTFGGVLPGNAVDGTGVSLVGADPDTRFLSSTNTEMVISVGTDTDYDIRKIQGKYNTVDSGATQLAFSLAPQVAALTEANVLEQYEFHLRMIVDGVTTNRKLERVSANTFRFAGEGLTAISATVAMADGVIQGFIPYTDKTTDVTIAAVRLNSMAPRLLVDYPMWTVVPTPGA